MKLREYIANNVIDENLANALFYSMRFSLNINTDPDIAFIPNGRWQVNAPRKINNNIFGPPTVYAIRPLEVDTLTVKQVKFGFSNEAYYHTYHVLWAYHGEQDTLFINLTHSVDNLDK